jgi:predicted MFS family arabinose efflux permease
MSLPSTYTSRGVVVPPTSDLSKRLVFLMAVSVGLAVACIYYSQPMLGILVASNIGSAQDIGWIPTLTQLGYASGILFLAPLGDRYNRKTIILIKGSILVVALLGFAASTGLPVMLITSLLIGVCATMAQDIVPAAASLAPENKRGKIIGTVMTGLLLGILLSRVISGVVADLLGWRYVFLIAAVSIAGCLFVLAKGLPSITPTTKLAYTDLMKSLFSLLGKYPALRTAALAQGLLSAGFSAFWSTLAVMLHAAPFHLSSSAAGAFGLAGAAGAMAAPFAGKFADKLGAKHIVRFGAMITAGFFLFMALGSQLDPKLALIVLVIGTVGFDLGVQVSLIGHQTIVYGLDAAARSRLNAVLLSGMFIGMSAGSAVGAMLLAHWGWTAVTIFGTLCGAGAYLVRQLHARKTRD